MTTQKLIKELEKKSKLLFPDCARHWANVKWEAESIFNKTTFTVHLGGGYDDISKEPISEYFTAKSVNEIFNEVNRLIDGRSKRETINHKE
ncbi:protein of unknown function [Tenacibaculum sp. 190524A02b]|uniref:hypothetical protein n=1 Tax=Tenacibaculum vairaonense TaxID=3137860 RepID=UPI0032B2184A